MLFRLCSQLVVEAKMEPIGDQEVLEEGGRCTVESTNTSSAQLLRHFRKLRNRGFKSLSTYS